MSQLTETTSRETQFSSPDATGPSRSGIRVLWIVAGVLALALVAVWYFHNVSVENNQRAIREIERIRPYYQNGEFKTAIEGDPSKRIGTERVRGLREIVGEWSGTDAGKVGALMLGNALLASDQAPKAAEPYHIAAESGDEMTRAAAHGGLGAVAESAKNYQEAAEHYLEAAQEDRSEVAAPQYLLQAARNLERAGKKDEAIKYYRTVATKYAQAGEPSVQARMALARNKVEL